MSVRSQGSAVGPGSRLVIAATNDVGGDTLNARAAIEAAAPDASYVRAFSTLGWELFDRPVVVGVQSDLFLSAPTARIAGWSSG